jgi:hypothetical protein
MKDVQFFDLDQFLYHNNIPEDILLCFPIDLNQVDCPRNIA